MHVEVEKAENALFVCFSSCVEHAACFVFMVKLWWQFSGNSESNPFASNVGNAALVWKATDDLSRRRRTSHTDASRRHSHCTRSSGYTFARRNFNSGEYSDDNKYANDYHRLDASG